MGDAQPVYTVAERRRDAAARQRAARDAMLPALRAYARAHRGRYVLFGSAARDTMKPESDLDLVVDFPGTEEGPATTFAELLGAEHGITVDPRPLWACGEHLRRRLETEGIIVE